MLKQESHPDTHIPSHIVIYPATQPSRQSNSHIVKKSTHSVRQISHSQDENIDTNRKEKEQKRQRQTHSQVNRQVSRQTTKQAATNRSSHPTSQPVSPVTKWRHLSRWKTLPENKKKKSTKKRKISPIFSLGRRWGRKKTWCIQWETAENTIRYDRTEQKHWKKKKKNCKRVMHNGILITKTMKSIE